MGARITKHPEPFLITGPGLHTPPGAGNGKLLETNSDKLLEKKKKIQLEIALPGTRPGVGKLQIKLSEMLCVSGAQTKLFYALLEFLFIVSSETHPGFFSVPSTLTAVFLGLEKGPQGPK